MAVNAQFKADFSTFNAAIDAASIKLVDFGKGASGVETKLNNMVDKFSGRKLIQDALLMEKAIADIGGASKLTADVLEQVGAKAAAAAEKMRAIGADVPAGLQDLAKHAKTAGESTSFMSTALSTATGVLGAFGVQLSVDTLINFGKAILDDADALAKM